METTKTGVMFDATSSRYVAFLNGEVVRRSKTSEGAEYGLKRAMQAAKRNGGSTVSYATLPVVMAGETPAPAAPRFHINERFKFLRQTVKMVASGLAPSALITGSGGLGKTMTVMRTLKESGFADVSSAVASGEAARRTDKTFIVVKGYSTAKGLFRTLYDNAESIIVFDDTDAILRDPVALNILKAALDSYDTRIISWNSEMRGDDDLPRSFIFTGRIIFISNYTESKIDQAIRSRSALVDVTMTVQETVDRMKFILTEDDFLPEFDMNVKQDAMEFIERMNPKMREINLRTLITVAKVRAADEDGTWERLAEYLTCK